MNKDEAHHLLNKRKQGFAVPLYLVNRALLVSGDISMACSPCQATWMEGSSMAQGQGVREMPNIPMAWDFERFNQHHESPQ
jgi:hypothetical protein